MLNPVSDIDISKDLYSEVRDFNERVDKFREVGPLDEVALIKLEEHFKASHVYHSAAMEGNRLTLQETTVVLQEGIDISGKPLKDSIEVKSLGEAFNYLKELGDAGSEIRETDIRALHSLVLSGQSEMHPGEYRGTGVTISGSEHTPPEPLEVPRRMRELVEWLKDYDVNDSLIVSTIAHHELTSIHPFLDGNGRVSRLLLNLILMKRCLPVCNIRRDQRVHYYEALAFADIGLYEPLIQVVLSNCVSLFAEYVRIREETERMRTWAAKWGDREAEVILRNANREFELWESRNKPILLEFKKAAELLNDEMEHVKVSYYEYAKITLEQYGELLERGATSRSGAVCHNLPIR